jgi:4-carboxymuconolactone decarboxylase
VTDGPPFLAEPSGHRDVALGLCRSAGRVLLVRNVRCVRGEPRPCWDLPGGEARPGEALRVAVAREWEEEVGFAAEVLDLVLVVDGSKRRAPEAPPLYTWRAFVFAVAPPPFGVLPRPGPEIEAIEMVHDRDAEARLSAPYHAPLRSLLRGDPERHRTVVWVEDGSETRPDAAASPVRRLLVLAAAAASGDARLVASETSAALAEGVEPAAIEETLLQIVPYAGFPRALAAFAAARPVLGPAPPPAPEGTAEGRPARGREAFETVYADASDRVRRGLETLHPLLPTWTVEEAYGRVLSRPGLATLERELLAVSILTALGGCDEALLGHARAARRLGASRADLESAVSAAPSSAGEGKRAAARAVLSRA